MPALLLIVLSLLLMVVRVAAPLGRSSEGRVQLVITLGLRERLLYHRTGLYAFGVILLLVALARLLSTQLQIIAVLACYGVLMIPVRYRFTTAGVGVNNVVFRRWSEFEGVERAARSITLRGAPGNGRFVLRLLGAHRDEALAVVRRHVRAEGQAPPSAGRKGGSRNRHAAARGAR
jgi:hypothetical protein